MVQRQCHSPPHCKACCNVYVRKTTCTLSKSSFPDGHLVVSKTVLPSGEAMRPRKDIPPEALRCARPAMGVLQEPSRAVKNALSHTTASRVSSWFSDASRSAAALSASLHAIPMAPCAPPKHV